MADAPFQPLQSETDWTNALSHSAEEPVLIFKHSSRCPVSGRANQELQSLADQVDLSIYRVVVQKNRALSDKIAATLDIRHETPQAIILEDRDAAFSTSHFRVTVETLREALGSVSASE